MVFQGEPTGSPFFIFQWQSRRRARASDEHTAFDFSGQIPDKEPGRR